MEMEMEMELLTGKVEDIRRDTESFRRKFDWKGESLDWFLGALRGVEDGDEDEDGDCDVSWADGVGSITNQSMNH